jgi:serine/threonine-protein kinase
MSGQPQHLTRARATLQWVGGTGNPPVVHGQTAVSSADLFTTGEVVADHYQIKQLLGAGGMGQVYEALDRALKRSVAMKVAWPHVGPEPLRLEAQVLAAFQHPGLVAVYGFARHKEHELLIMERLTGKPLADVLVAQESGLMPLSDVFEIVFSICNTLSVLHASGLAHCDLKPANIMMAAGGRVVLLDLGIVRIEQLRGDQRTISGSPHYMAPETIRGIVRPGESHLVDVYALGAILFVLFTGQAPFDHKDPSQLMIQHLEREAPKLRSLRPELPQALDNLVARMLEKLPQERPDRIETVRDELRAISRRLTADTR